MMQLGRTFFSRDLDEPIYLKIEIFRRITFTIRAILMAQACTLKKRPVMGVLRLHVEDSAVDAAVLHHYSLALRRATKCAELELQRRVRAQHSRLSSQT